MPRAEQSSFIFRDRSLWSGAAEYVCRFCARIPKLRRGLARNHTGREEDRWKWTEEGENGARQREETKTAVATRRIVKPIQPFILFPLFFPSPRIRWFVAPHLRARWLDFPCTSLYQFSSHSRSRPVAKDYACKSLPRESLFRATARGS